MDEEVSSLTSVGEFDSPNEYAHHKKLVWPWIGIVVNIPTNKSSDGQLIGESGSKLRNELTAKGFNPTRVTPLWNYQGHSGTALVEFNKHWLGLHNAMSFEKAYEANRHGKRDWEEVYRHSDVKYFGLYGWVARLDDYNANNIVGVNLRRIGDPKTIAEIMEEEATKQHSLVSNITNVIKAKGKHVEEIRKECLATLRTRTWVMEENNRLQEAYDEEKRKIQLSSRIHLERIFKENDMAKLQVESEIKELELRVSELEQLKAHTESERKKISQEMKMIAMKNSSLRLAALEQNKTDEKIRHLAEKQESEKKELHYKIIQLEKERDAKWSLELEIETLKGELNMMKHIENEADMKRKELLSKTLKDKEDEKEKLDKLNQTLIINERKTNEQFQEGRTQFIRDLAKASLGGHIGIKRMGELDTKPFLEAMKKKNIYSQEEADIEASKLISSWEDYLKDSNWHPFKRVKVVLDGTEKEIEVTDDNDPRLKDLKNEMGEDVYNAVSTALMEINEYNASGGYTTSEIWNFKEGRKASLSEGVKFVLNELKIRKSRKSQKKK